MKLMFDEEAANYLHWKPMPPLLRFLAETMIEEVYMQSSPPSELSCSRAEADPSSIYSEELISKSQNLQPLLVVDVDNDQVLQLIPEAISSVSLRPSSPLTSRKLITFYARSGVLEKQSKSSNHECFHSLHLDAKCLFTRLKFQWVEWYLSMFNNRFVIFVARGGPCCKDHDRFCCAIARVGAGRGRGETRREQWHTRNHQRQW